MGALEALTVLLKGKKKLKTLITVPGHNFQSLTTLVNAAEELELTGSDGNNVPFAQSIHAGANSIVFFDTSTRNFVKVDLNGEISPNYQLVHLVRNLA